MDQEEQVSVLYRVRKTVYQMLKDRGYMVNAKKFAESKQEFTDSFNGQRNSLNILVRKRQTQDGGAGDQKSIDDSLLVFFHDQDKLNVQHLADITRFMVENSVMNGIIIIKGTTPVTRRVS